MKCNDFPPCSSLAWDSGNSQGIASFLSFFQVFISPLNWAASASDILALSLYGTPFVQTKAARSQRTWRSTCPPPPPQQSPSELPLSRACCLYGILSAYRIHMETSPGVTSHLFPWEGMMRGSRSMGDVLKRRGQGSFTEEVSTDWLWLGKGPGERGKGKSGRWWAAWSTWVPRL